jgi:MFS transporter, Spinster family, sphingosine-1-phosphate transporter
MVQAVNEARISRAGWYAVALVATTNAVSLLDRNVLAILAPRIKHDLGVGDAEMGLLYGTVFALFYALFSLPLGRLADGWQRARLLAIAVGFWSVATAFGAAAQGFALLALARLGVGVGEGAVYPAGTSLVFDQVPKPQRGLAMAWIAAAIALGLGGSAVLGGVTADWWDHRYAATAAPLALRGWQFAFLVAASPGIVLATLLWRLPEPTRGQMDGVASKADPHPFRASLALLGAIAPVCNWWALARRRASSREWLVNLGALVLIVVAVVALTRITSSLASRPPLHFGSLSINPHSLQWSVVGLGTFVVLNLLQRLRAADTPTFALLTRSPSLVLCLAIGSLQTMINYGIMGFTPSFIMKNYHSSPATTGLQFGVLSAAIGVVGPLVAGRLSDRMHARFPGAGRAYVTLFALGLSPLIALWVYSATDLGSFYARFVPYGLVLTGWLPPLYAIMFEQVLPRMRGVTASVYVVVSTIFGLGIGPFVVGMISDATGGNLAKGILSINWVAPIIIVMLIMLARRAAGDEAQLLARARAAGEAV